MAQLHSLRQHDPRGRCVAETQGAGPKLVQCACVGRTIAGRTCRVEAAFHHESPCPPTRTQHQRSLEQPADLGVGRALGPADSTREAEAIVRYRTDKVKGLQDGLIAP